MTSTLKTLDEESSLRLKILRFPLIVGVIFIHNADSVVRFAQGVNSGTASANVLTDFIRNLVSQGIARTAVPLFFLMSGYFFFRGLQSLKHDYFNRINSRIRSLLVPFLIWNIATLIVLAIGQFLPVTQGYFSGRTLAIASFNFYDYIDAIFGITRRPISYQFWFIRDLMVLVLLAPAINFLITSRVQAYYISILAGCWLLGVWPSPIPSAEAALFFSVGSVFAFNKKSLFGLDDKWLPISIAYFITLLADILLRGTEWGQYLHRTGIVLGVISALCLTKIIIRHARLKEVLVSLSGVSFFIFAAHEPMLTIVKKIVYKVIQPTSSLSNLALYFLIPISLIILLIWTYRICERTFPATTRVITGGR